MTVKILYEFKAMAGLLRSNLLTKSHDRKCANSELICLLQ